MAITLFVRGLINSSIRIDVGIKVGIAVNVKVGSAVGALVEKRVTVGKSVTVGWRVAELAGGIERLMQPTSIVPMIIMMTLIRLNSI